MQSSQAILRGRLLVFVVFSNLRLLWRGEISWRQFALAIRRQLILSSITRDAKLVRTGDKIFIHSYLPHFPSRFFQKSMANNSKERYPLKPNYITISITHKCPCQCSHCHAQDSGECEPPLSRLVQLIREAVEFEFPVVNFSGGEPLSRFDDLLGLVKEAHAQMDTRLFTSGVGGTSERWRRLADAGLVGAQISLDSYSEEAHNRRRGYHGAYKASCQAIRDAVKAGLHVEVICCTRSSMIRSGEVFKTVDFVEGLGAQAIQLQAIKPAGGAMKAQDPDLFFAGEDKRTLIRYQREQNRGPRRIAIVLPWRDEEPDRMGCTAVSGQHAYVDVSGEVSPCSLLRLSLGNVQERSFKEIWGAFLRQCEHPVRDCAVFRLADRLSREKKLPLPPERTLELWPELRGLPPSDLALKLRIKRPGST